MLPVLADAELIRQNWDLLTPEERREFCDLLGARAGRLNKYITDFHVPHPKQMIFLSRDEEEVLYGGAAGGGKSDALLMGALQYVDTPGYAALLLRKTYADLSLPGALMDRAREWLQGMDAKWYASNYTWRFPSGATITFGYLQDSSDKYRYASSEFQYIGFDELTQFAMDDYKFLFSRLRRANRVKAPPRMRSASNPGGIGHEWVKAHFIPEQYNTMSLDERFERIWPKEDRLFIPARLEDNASLNAAEYDSSLSRLGAAVREQLRWGDWDAVEEGRYFRKDWFRTYIKQGAAYILDKGEGQRSVVPYDRLERFLVVDTASTVKSTSAYTVIMVCALDPATYNLLILDVWRGRVTVPEIPPIILKYMGDYKCQYAVIENKENGIGIIQQLRTPYGQGITIKDFNPGVADPISRSTVAQIRMEAGQIWFPQETDWLKDLKSEMLSFPEGNYIDQVVCMSMAAITVQDRARLMGGCAMPTPLHFPNPGMRRGF